METRITRTRSKISFGSVSEGSGYCFFVLSLQQNIITVGGGWKKFLPHGPQRAERGEDGK